MIFISQVLCSTGRGFYDSVAICQSAFSSKVIHCLYAGIESETAKIPRQMSFVKLVLIFSSTTQDGRETLKNERHQAYRVQQLGKSNDTQAGRSPADW
jgi:hypothetical protein